jgi:hypothetical protein
MDAKGNILHEELISLASTDYVDEEGFFFHATTGGPVKYCALSDKSDAAAVTKTFASPDIYNNPVLVRKIFKTGTSATGIYAGKGI